MFIVCYLSVVRVTDYLFPKTKFYVLPDSFCFYFRIYHYCP